LLDPASVMLTLYLCVLCLAAMWLKGKGDDFFRLGDYFSAISAYSAALAEKSTFVAALLNRAACYLKVIKLEDCEKDCSAVIDAGVSASSDDSATPAQVCKAYARRMFARSCQGRFADAAADANAALQLSPDQADMAACNERLLSLKTAEEDKREGDAAQKSGDMAAAAEAYGRALDKEPDYAQCMLNRAAALLALGQYAECAEDCSRVLELLGVNEQGESLKGESELPNISSDSDLTPVPVRGSTLHTQCVARAAARLIESRKRLASSKA
jgi:tetratricopeptide (TPR) repeat protein